MTDRGANQLSRMIQVARSRPGAVVAAAVVELTNAASVTVWMQGFVW